MLWNAVSEKVSEKNSRVCLIAHSNSCVCTYLYLFAQERAETTHLLVEGLNEITTYPHSKNWYGRSSKYFLLLINSPFVFIWKRKGLKTILTLRAYSKFYYRPQR